MKTYIIAALMALATTPAFSFQPDPDSSYDAWTYADGDYTTTNGLNRVETGSAPGLSIGDRARVFVGDSASGDDRHDRTFKIAVEAREYDASNTEPAEVAGRRQSMGGLFDAVRFYTDIITVRSGLIGVTGRAMMLGHNWEDYPLGEKQENFAVGVQGEVSFTNPAATNAGVPVITTGWIRDAVAGAFQITGDNARFTGFGSALINQPSIDNAVAVYAGYLSGASVGKDVNDQDGPSRRFGSTIGEFIGVKVEARLQADYEEPEPEFEDLVYDDRIDSYIGILLKAPTKKLDDSTTGLSVRQSAVNNSIRNSVGLKIEAPNLDTDPSTNPEGNVSPSDYVGIQCDAKANFTDTVAVSGAVNVTGSFTATNLYGNGSGLTSLNASNIASGTLNDLRLSSAAQDAITKRHSQNTDTGTDSNSFIIGSGRTGSSGSLIFAETFDDSDQDLIIAANADGGEFDFVRYADGSFAEMATIYAGSIIGSFFGNGSGISSLNASNLASGTVSDSRLTTTAQDAFTKRHAQNTDTGTNTGIFHVNNTEAPIEAGLHAGEFYRLTTDAGGAWRFYTTETNEELPVTMGNLYATYGIQVGGGAGITKYLSASSSITSFTATLNSVTVKTVTCTGAASGDTATVTPPSTIEANLIWSAYVSAADTVTIRILNPTNGNISVATQNWRVSVIKH